MVQPQSNNSSASTGTQNNKPLTPTNNTTPATNPNPSSNSSQSPNPPTPPKNPVPTPTPSSNGGALNQKEGSSLPKTLPPLKKQS